jgi:CBS-domain-containing membrane protein
MTYLLKHFSPRHVWAAFVFINGLITIAILALLAVVTGSTFIFPSLGPTAILFFMSPKSNFVRPRNVLLGHAIGIVCGYLALVITGLTAAGSVTDIGTSLPRVIAAALALGGTGAGMVLLRSPHAPAGATTLIIALGFITKPFDLIIIEVAVGLLVLRALVINRVAAVGGPTAS